MRRRELSVNFVVEFPSRTNKKNIRDSVNEVLTVRKQVTHNLLVTWVFQGSNVASENCFFFSTNFQSNSGRTSTSVIFVIRIPRYNSESGLAITS